MPLRILVAGGLREPGAWDAYARAAGEHLARAGVGLTTLASSGFGRAMIEGFLKIVPEPAPGLVAAYPFEGAPALPDALAPFAIEPLPLQAAGNASAQMLRESDAVLIAGHGRGLGDLYHDAARRNVPVVPLPIEQATSEEIWEEALRHPQRAFASLPLHQAFAALRRPDPRSQRSSEALAKLLVEVAGAPALPTGPSVLLVAPPALSLPEAAQGMDDMRTVLRRALRSASPGARVTEAAYGWLRSPGRALWEAIRSSDVVVVDLTGSSPGALYALGLARGAERPAIALAGRGAPLGVDAGAVDAITWSDPRELAARLDRKLPDALRVVSARARPPPRETKRGRPGRKRRPRKPRASDAPPRGDGGQRPPKDDGPA